MGGNGALRVVETSVNTRRHECAEQDPAVRRIFDSAPQKLNRGAAMDP